MDIFSKLLPTGVVIGEEFERTPGIFINGASLKNALVSYLRTSSEQPLTAMSFVIGIQGRGTLNIPGSEFMDLLAAMTAITKNIAGLDEPTLAAFLAAESGDGATALANDA